MNAKERHTAKRNAEKMARIIAGYNESLETAAEEQAEELYAQAYDSVPSLKEERAYDHAISDLTKRILKEYKKSKRMDEYARKHGCKARRPAPIPFGLHQKKMLDLAFA